MHTLADRRSPTKRNESTINRTSLGVSNEYHDTDKYTRARERRFTRLTGPNADKRRRDVFIASRFSMLRRRTRSPIRGNFDTRETRIYIRWTCRYPLAVQGRTVFYPVAPFFANPAARERGERKRRFHAPAKTSSTLHGGCSRGQCHPTSLTPAPDTEI